MSKENLRIKNEDSWQEDRFWVCPDCEHKNHLSAWMGEEICSECGNLQFFDSDYVDAYEGIISTVYLGPRNRE